MSNHPHNSFQQNVTQAKANYNSYNTNSNMGNPRNGTSGSYAPTNIAYNTPNYMSHDLPQRFSDQHMFDDNTRTVSKQIIRKRKLWISSKNARTDSNGLSYDFSVNTQRYKNIRSIKTTQVVVDYVAADAVEILSGGVLFDDLPHYEENTIGDKYHCMFPVTQGSDGTSVKFTFGYNDTYISDSPQLFNIDSNFNVRVFYEDVNGKFVPWTSLSRISVEIELSILEYSQSNNRSMQS